MLSRDSLFFFLPRSAQAPSHNPPTTTQPEVAKQSHPIAYFGTGSKNRVYGQSRAFPKGRPTRLSIDGLSLVPWGISRAPANGDVYNLTDPAKPGEIIWGAGPTFTLPTATDSLLGNGQFSMGPAAVALSIQGHWLFGVLMNNQWSVAGWGDKPVNALVLQPFVNYNLPDGWYLTSVPIMTANWKADKAGDVWTVPLGGGVGKLFKVDKLPIDMQLQAFGNVAKPQDGADWQLRFQIKVLFPE